MMCFQGKGAIHRADTIPHIMKFLPIIEIAISYTSFLQRIYYILTYW